MPETPTKPPATQLRVVDAASSAQVSIDGDFPDHDVIGRLLIHANKRPAFVDGQFVCEPGGVARSAANLDTIMTDPRLVAALRHDTLAGRITYQGAPIEDRHGYQIRVWIGRTYGQQWTQADIWTAIEEHARRRPYSPVVEYLTGLTWDGYPRVASWLTDYTGCADTPLARSYGARWLISAVRRALYPGCKADAVLVLIGAQGRRKSSILEALVHNREWYTDEAIDPTDAQRTGQGIAGKWIVELAELAAVRGKAIEGVRALITRRVDRYRPAYARQVVDQPRQCVFAGTSNAEDILSDPYGSRRYWPVTVGRCDVDGLIKVRDQLWAEAVTMARQTDPYIQHWLDDEDEAQRIEESVEFSERDVWADQVEEWVHTHATRTITVGTILLDALDIEVARQGLLESRRVTTILRNMGWRSRRIRQDGRRIWVWGPPEEQQPVDI